MMKLEELIKENPGISLNVNAQDLKEFGQNIADKTARFILDNKEEKIFSRNQVMQKFGVCSATLWRWQKSGRINGRRITGRLFYPESEIKKLME